MKQEREESRWAIPVMVLAGAMLTIGVLLAYVSHAVLDADQFADRGASTLEDEAVRAELADAAVEGLVAADADLADVGPLLDLIAQAALDTDAVEDAVRVGLDELHQLLLDGEAQRAVVRVENLLTTVHEQLTDIAPDAAAELPGGGNDAILPVADRTLLDEIVTAVESTRLGAVVLPMLAVGLLVVVVVRSTDQYRRLASVALVFAFVGAGLGTTEGAGRMVFDRIVGDAAATAIWDAYLGDLSTWGSIILVVGAASWFIVAVDRAHRDPWVAVAAACRRFLATPESRWGNLGRAVAVVLAGTWALVDPSTVGGVVVAVGVGVALVGASGFLGALDRSPAS